MSDQMMPPGAQPPPGAEPPQAAPPVIVQQDQLEVTDSLLRACKVAAQKSSAAADTREMAEAAKAALAFAQAVVILDPTRDQTGVPLDHHLELAARQKAAAAPTPVRSLQP